MTTEADIVVITTTDQRKHSYPRAWGIARDSALEIWHERDKKAEKIASFAMSYVLHWTEIIKG